MLGMTQSLKLLLTALAGASLISVASPASAAVCFTAFSGTIHYQFNTTAATLRVAGNHDVSSVTFGALSGRAGLQAWPVVGGAFSNSSLVTLAFRAMTVDASSCGAVDLIASLTPSTLTGPLQLWNQRTSFGNTSALPPAACVTPPEVAAERSPTSTYNDATGNLTK